MQKDVLVFMESRQNGPAVLEDKMEVIMAGQYYFKNGKHFVMYEELSEDGKTLTKNMIRIGSDAVEIRKSGQISSSMRFEEHKKHVSWYTVPYGRIMVGLDTRRVEIEEEEDRIRVRLEYDLEMEQQIVAACEVLIRVESKDRSRVDLENNEEQQ